MFHSLCVICWILLHGVQAFNDRKCQNNMKSTMYKMKHYLRHENKVNDKVALSYREALSNIYWACIGSGNDLGPGRWQAITRTNTVPVSFTMPQWVYESCDADAIYAFYLRFIIFIILSCLLMAAEYLMEHYILH